MILSEEDEGEALLDTEAVVLLRESVAKKYARFFQSTLHHNNGYFAQVAYIWRLRFPKFK